MRRKQPPRLAESLHPASETAHRHHQRSDETSRARSPSLANRAERDQAYTAFFQSSRVYPYLYRAYHERPYTPDLIEFVVKYLEVDPWCQRSGYHKERMLDRLKSAHLSEGHRQRLRTVLVDAVARRGSREFRHYCRLAPFLANPELVEKIRRFARDGDPPQRHRALLMLRTLRETP